LLRFCSTKKESSLQRLALGDICVELIPRHHRLWLHAPPDLILELLGRFKDLEGLFGHQILLLLFLNYSMVLLGALEIFIFLRGTRLGIFQIQ
jgi:hypothetical protein